MKSSYDVVILGGGPAGLASAIALLRQAKVSVLIAEGRDAGALRIGESVPPDLLLLLEQLGLTAAFRAGGHTPCPGYASVWGSPRPGYNDFIVNPLGPGWRLDRAAFDQMLAEAATAAGAELNWSLRFSKLQRTENRNDGYRLGLLGANDKRGYDVRARYVIDATGSGARFAKALGIDRRLDDRLFALARFARIETGDMTRQVLLEATPDGWWYSALLPGGRLVSMVVAEPQVLKPLLRSKREGFEQALERTTFVGPKQAVLSLRDPQYATWPIYSGLLDEVEGGDWIAVGDAAASYDPVSAQGIYKALHNAIAAGKRVADQLTGERRAGQAYGDSIRQGYDAYRQNRAHLYSLERRWPTAPFWRHRRATAVA